MHEPAAHPRYPNKMGNERDPMKYRYVVFAGRVQSQYDKEFHFIGAHQVARLYGLDPSNPPYDLYLVHDEHEKLPAHLDDVSRLYPRDDGNYSLPTV